MQQNYDDCLGFTPKFDVESLTVIIPKSEVQRHYSAPSFAEQGNSDLGAASFDAGHCGHETPCTSKPISDFLALYFGFRDSLNLAFHPNRNELKKKVENLETS